MAIETIPWFIGLEGVKHSAEVARMMAWAATNGATGIVKPQDLQVRPQAAPDGTVRVMPGGFVAESRFSGAGQQSYMGRAPTATTVEVPPTGSSGPSRRFVVAQVRDPHYPGNGDAPATPDLANLWQYVRLLLVSSLSGSRTEVPLARIDQPANTTFVDGDMITDLREVANPRTLDVWRPRASVAADREDLTAQGDDGEWFPNGGGSQMIDIPTWATRAQIRATWMAVRIASGRNGWGRMWVEYGPYLRPSTRERRTQDYQWDTAGTHTNTYRETWMIADDVYIPPGYRGTSQLFVMKANRSPSSDNRTASIDGVSGVSLEVRFREAADPSTS